MTRRFPIVLLAMACAPVLASAASPVAAFELGGLFRTPEQRAAARFEAGEYEALVEEAPDAGWEGIGRYATGDARGAAEAFARALDAETDASTRVRDDLLYNRATAETRAGRLDDAIALYDELLERDPDREDARHNRDVALALKALEEQQGESSGSEQGEGERRDGEGNEGEDEGAGQEGDDESGEPGDGESGDDAPESGEAGENAPGDEGADGERRDPASGDAEAPDDERAAEARADAQAALEAERRRAERGEDGAGSDEVLGAEQVRTPTESEQATEQWLRRIADDPSGLLRRRLERSHRGDYPEVGDGDEPW